MYVHKYINKPIGYDPAAYDPIEVNLSQINLDELSEENCECVDLKESDSDNS